MSDVEYCRDLYARTAEILQILCHKGNCKARLAPFKTVADARSIFEQICKIAAQELGVPLVSDWPTFLHECTHAKARNSRVMWMDGRSNIAEVLSAR